MSPPLTPSSSSRNDANDDESVAARQANLDELKWFEHRWLDKHGKHSELKEFREKMTLMRHWFESLDVDGSGEVGLNELEDPLVSVGLARNRDDVQKLIDEVDKEGRGEVTFDEFLHLMYPKKVKRQRSRTPLHVPKTRAPADDIHAPPTTSSAKASATRPSSPLTSPRAPTSPSGGRSNSALSSPRHTSRCVIHAHTDKIDSTSDSKSDKSKNKAKAKINPVVKLFEDLQSGKLGDLAIPFPVLITAYRRRMLLNAHMADDPTVRSLGASVLQALESSRRETASQSSHFRRSDSVVAPPHSFLRQRSSLTTAANYTNAAPVAASTEIQNNQSPAHKATAPKRASVHTPANHALESIGAHLPALE